MACNIEEQLSDVGKSMIKLTAMSRLYNTSSTSERSNFGHQNQQLDHHKEKHGETRSGHFKLAALCLLLCHLLLLHNLGELHPVTQIRNSDLIQNNIEVLVMVNQFVMDES